MLNLPTFEERSKFVRKLNEDNIKRSKSGYSGTMRVEWFNGIPMECFENSRKPLGSREYKILVKKK